MIWNAISLKMFELYYHYYVNIHPMVIVVCFINFLKKNFFLIGKLTQCHWQHWVFSSPPLKGHNFFQTYLNNYHWQQWGFFFILCQKCHDFLQIWLMLLTKIGFACRSYFSQMECKLVLKLVQIWEFLLRRMHLLGKRRQAFFSKGTG
jgi:hypothetical protein